MADRKRYKPNDLRPLRCLARPGHAARSRSLQTGRHHHLHWMQSVRSGVRGVERYAVTPTTFDNTYQTMPETRWNFLEPHQVQRAQESDGTIQC